MAGYVITLWWRRRTKSPDATSRWSLRRLHVFFVWTLHCPRRAPVGDDRDDVGSFQLSGHRYQWMWGVNCETDLVVKTGTSGGYAGRTDVNTIW